MIADVFEAAVVRLDTTQRVCARRRAAGASGGAPSVGDRAAGPTSFRVSRIPILRAASVHHARMSRCTRV